MPTSVVAAGPPGEGTEVPLGHVPTRPDPLRSLFDRTYPAAVGLARQVLDRDRVTLALSLPASEQLVMEVFVRSSRRRLHDDASGVAVVMGRVADACLDRLVGHPGTVELRADLLGADVVSDGTLRLAELQPALSDLRRRDRRVGLLTIAAGLTPADAAALLDMPLDETLRCLARVGTRLTDGRRVGAAPTTRTHA